MKQNIIYIHAFLLLLIPRIVQILARRIIIIKPRVRLRGYAREEFARNTVTSSGQ